MAIRPRIAVREHARAGTSPISRAFLKRVAPLFAGKEISGGPMLLATFVALVLSSSPLASGWEDFWGLSLEISLGSHSLSHSLAEWIDHALLPLFFVIIGTDMKREIVTGELSRWRSAAFPLLGAIGGMVVPVGLFLVIAGQGPEAAGWGAVVVTDTAFGLALLAIFSDRFPAGLRALLLAFAAIDDVGGLLVIAGAYTRHIEIVGLVVAAVSFGVMLLLRKLRWFSSFPYVLLSIATWGGIFASGIHATIAGVVIGFVAPVRPRLDKDAFSRGVQRKVDDFQDAYRQLRQADGDDRIDRAAHHEVEAHLGYLDEMTAATEVTGDRLVGVLTPWVSYFVLPLFVLSNVHVAITPDALAGAVASPLAPAVVAALVLGKPIGFLFASWLGTRTGIARLPSGVTWRMVLAMSSLAGIGFTISLFIADLAFADSRLVEQASLGTLAASAVAGLAGYVFLRFAGDRPKM
ncbi:Na+/H+ antiporter NhaA [Sphingomonas sp. LH128]|uniref:Na+/H+ antiporter NhaA n=1 Tax=Sphingomonas sp. LH128 TaxID=473781 RepID=UPI00027CC929|nr:Na+/H+ antiporter NhaA [Sphingomonas sp. LH128]EJU14847.1 Na+/H+ antiporter NhaA [Sphingomonas sp. LH128]